jgi:hypothetical protein
MVVCIAIRVRKYQQNSANHKGFTSHCVLRVEDALHVMQTWRAQVYVYVARVHAGKHVCMCLCACVCVCICMCEYMCQSVYVCAYVCQSVCVCASPCVCACA